MCGIAGYSLSSESRIDRTLAAQTLLAAIAERGSDAAGYAYRGPGLELEVHKQRTGASDLLDLVGLPKGAGQVLLHVRDYTKGHPSLAANNHPIRHGTVVGIHNGIVANDEEIFARRGYERAEDGMTVDSEAIFALMEDEANDAAALAELYGSMAAAWIDERVPDVLFLARGVGRPLWIGQGKHELFFASTCAIRGPCARQARACRGHAARRQRRLCCPDGEVPAGSQLPRGAAAGRPRAGRAALGACPPRRDRHRRSLEGLTVR